MDKHWSQMEADLEAIKESTPRILLHEGRELKGNKLFQAVRKAEKLRANNQDIDPELAIAPEILLKLLAILIRYPTPIFYGAVDDAGYQNYLNRRRNSFAEMISGPFARNRELALTGASSGFSELPELKTKTTA
jgi:hypothetical protein